MNKKYKDQDDKGFKEGDTVSFLRQCVGYSKTLKRNDILVFLTPVETNCLF